MHLWIEYVERQKEGAAMTLVILGSEKATLVILTPFLRGIW